MCLNTIITKDPRYKRGFGYKVMIRFNPDYKGNPFFSEAKRCVVDPMTRAIYSNIYFAPPPRVLDVSTGIAEDTVDIKDYEFGEWLTIPPALRTKTLHIPFGSYSAGFHVYTTIKMAVMSARSWNIDHQKSLKKLNGRDTWYKEKAEAYLTDNPYHVIKVAYRGARVKGRELFIDYHTGRRTEPHDSIIVADELMYLHEVDAIHQLEAQACV